MPTPRPDAGDAPDPEELGGDRPAVLLDRDGVVNLHRDDYVLDWDQFRWTPGLFEDLRRLREAGYVLAVVTNQSPVGRGLLTVDELQALHQRMRRELAKRRIEIEGVFHCPHPPWAGCGCRKPEPGMILQAARELDLDLTASYLIGDRASDVEAGRRAGVKEAFLVERDAGPREAVDAILDAP